MGDKPKIEVLVGMIAAGKSTYARKRADEGALVVSHDDLTEMLHARYRYEQEKKAVYRKMEEELVRIAINDGFDVVIDRTHLTRESRRRWIEFGRWPHFAEWAEPKVVAVVFPLAAPDPSNTIAGSVPAQHALRRLRSDARGRCFADWLKVAEHHYAQWLAEPIHEGEGFSEII